MAPELMPFLTARLEARDLFEEFLPERRILQNVVHKSFRHGAGLPQTFPFGCGNWLSPAVKVFSVTSAESKEAQRGSACAASTCRFLNCLVSLSRAGVCMLKMKPKCQGALLGSILGLGSGRRFRGRPWADFGSGAADLVCFFKRLLTQLAGVQQGQPTTCAADHAEPPVSGAHQEDALCHLSCHT